MELKPSELAALRQFLQTVTWLPFWEWGAVPILLLLSFLDQPGCCFLIMGITFIVVLIKKMSAMKALEREWRGVSYFVRGYHAKLSGAATLPYIGSVWFVPKLTLAALLSMPAFFEAMTAASALPKAYGNWSHNPQVAERFMDEWRSTVPEFGRCGLPGVLLALLAIGSVIQAGMFARFMRKAMAVVKQFEDRPAHLFDGKEAAARTCRLHHEFWSLITEAAGQSNLSMLGDLARSMKGELRKRDEFFQKVGIKSGLSPNIQKEMGVFLAGIPGEHDLGTMRVYLRLLGTAGVNLWFKISLFSISFSYTNAELELAIGMGILTIALALRSQHEMFKFNSTVHQEEAMKEYLDDCLKLGGRILFFASRQVHATNVREQLRLSRHSPPPLDAGGALHWCVHM